MCIKNDIVCAKFFLMHLMETNEDSSNMLAGKSKMDFLTGYIRSKDGNRMVTLLQGLFEIGI